MKRTRFVLVSGLALLGLTLGLVTMSAGDAVEPEVAPDWSVKATIIEACSCPMFCQCYFNNSPAGHHGHGGDAEHFCRFNNAFKISEGNYGDVSLAGAKFWVAGDLGSDFSTGHMDWAVLTFDGEVGEVQRQAITTLLGHVYPVKWDSFSIAEDAKMEWQLDAERARATLDGGKTAEVVLERLANHTANPVIRNLNYWGLPRHEGFVLMPNKVEAYRAGDKPFEYGGGNGFTLTFDLSSADVTPAAGG